ncbi:putative DNA-binding transcriptional regulator [Kitasatospora sp. GP30]|uniref:helix-turn-helix domain-containing protein n=1 Tax=Kitasatospora sp. GP30 TaxID=3035084 RepID=UPI000C712392|nr:helix-turn-helix transcriptional regulator [Kitasatospora sp. GP30]MDH6139929.1 putative DNA-binding transcriptional regulator [Kitasatospora sp. GP30]
MDLPALTSQTVALYRQLLSEPRSRVADAAAALGLTEETARALVDELSTLGLVRTAPDDEQRLVAVNPAVAVAQTLFPEERDLRKRQQELARARAELEELEQFYTEHRKQCRGAAAIEILPGLDAVRSMLRQLADSCVEEVLTSQPGGGRATPVLEEAIGRDEEMLRRGVRIRTLYQHTARYDPPTAAYVERVTRLGAEVRTLSDGFARMIVFDRRVGVVSLHDEPYGAVLVHDASLLDFMLTSFERAWVEAAPYPTSYSQREVQALSAEIRKDIVQLLVAGLDDRAISRRLGMALRTCQRHISTIMEGLGARSRLQAGYLIAQQGLLEESRRPQDPPTADVPG